MKLPVTNWNHPSGATDELVEFPDEPIQKFMAWMFGTRQWKESPEMVYPRFRRLQEELMAWKNEQAVKAAHMTAEQEQRSAKRLKSLEKARAMRAAKRAAKNGA